MNAEIIAIGNEVVKGHVVNTNAAHIARRLEELGISVDCHSTVKDDPVAIKETFNQAMMRSHYIVITGGLGPTKDDLTKETICEAIGMPMYIREELLEKIKAHFEKIKKVMPDINKKQAAFPNEAYILKNVYGTAPGCVIPYQRRKIILLPGPPSELYPMIENELVPYLIKKQHLYSETLDIKLFGISESEVAVLLCDLLQESDEGSIATYVGEYEIVVRIAGWHKEKKKVKEFIFQNQKQVEERLEKFIIGYNQDRLEDKIVKWLLDNQKTITTVESCTGGMLAQTLVNCEGVSACFNEGIVTYSNQAKMKYVGVKEETLQKVGAVSRETAKEMAEGIRRQAGADIGLSTTGIAGPGGGTEEKPVGLVYIGIATENETNVYELHLSGSRQAIREKTVKNVLFQLYQLFK